MVHEGAFVKPASHPDNRQRAGKRRIFVHSSSVHEPDSAVVEDCGGPSAVRKIIFAIVVAGTVAGITALPQASAWAGPSAYNIDLLLDQPYPLAMATGNSAFERAPLPESQIYRPARVPPPDTEQPFPARSAASPTMAQIRPSVSPVPPMKDEPMETGKTGIARYLSEIRVGVLAHDRGPFGRHKESGIDGNIEFLFVSPDILHYILSPRPQIGFSVNSDRNTSSGYFGLNWEWRPWGGLFADFSFGGMVHDGHMHSNDIHQKELGCHLLFRESIEVGWRIANRHSLSFLVDHSSNGRLCSKNEGLNDLGIRYGYKF